MTQLSSFDSRLKADFDTLPPQLKEAARWVIDHPDDVALLSLREQARRAGIAVTMAFASFMPMRYGSGRTVIAAAPRNCWCGATVRAIPRWCRISSHR
jgi:hypothetical protein